MESDKEGTRDLLDYAAGLSVDNIDGPEMVG